MAVSLGAVDYREGAFARLAEAWILYEGHRWTGAAYLAGRAAEAILRSLLWLRTREHEVGHDLRDLLTRAQELGLIADPDAKLENHINDVAVVWNNNLRFAGDGAFLRHLKEIGKHQKVKGDRAKYAAKMLLQACEAIVARGEVAWQRCRKS